MEEKRRKKLEFWTRFGRRAERYDWNGGHCSSDWEVPEYYLVSTYQLLKSWKYNYVNYQLCISLSRLHFRWQDIRSRITGESGRWPWTESRRGSNCIHGRFDYRTCTRYVKKYCRRRSAPRVLSSIRIVIDYHYVSLISKYLFWYRNIYFDIGISI